MINETVFEKFPVLETKRLKLRAIQKQDAEAIFRMRANERVGTFIPRPLLQESQTAIELVDRVINGFNNKSIIAWAGEIKSTGEIIGTCGFNTIDRQNLRAEIGGEMDVQYWGKFYAIEAVEGIIKFGLETIGFHTIEAKVSPLNKSAVAVLTQLGFEKEAHFKDRIYFNQQYSDMAVYTLLNKVGSSKGITL